MNAAREGPAGCQLRPAPAARRSRGTGALSVHEVSVVDTRDRLDAETAVMDSAVAGQRRRVWSTGVAPSPPRCPATRSISQPSLLARQRQILGAPYFGSAAM